MYFPAFIIDKNGDMFVKKKLLIGIIALIGFITTIKLAVIYYESNYNPYALSSFCSINEFVDCDGIAKTTASQSLGIPLAYWGMGFYLFVWSLSLFSLTPPLLFYPYFSFLFFFFT